MAQNNIEVEIKTKISKKQFADIKLKLKKISKPIKEIHHIDDYYTPKHKDFLKPKYPYEWLSVRNRGSKVILNYKCWYPKGVKNTKYCDEYETEVSDIDQLKKIFKVLDIKKIVTVDKKRLSFNYKNKFEIALDEVKGLGFFIEVEALKNKRNLNETHKELVEFAKTLGVEKIIMVPGGYGAEMLRKVKK